MHFFFSTIKKYRGLYFHLVWQFVLIYIMVRLTFCFRFVYLFVLSLFISSAGSIGVVFSAQEDARSSSYNNSNGNWNTSCVVQAPTPLHRMAYMHCLLNIILFRFTLITHVKMYYICPLFCFIVINSLVFNFANFLLDSHYACMFCYCGLLFAGYCINLAPRYWILAREYTVSPCFRCSVHKYFRSNECYLCRNICSRSNIRVSKCRYVVVIL